ncbi:SlyX family protein [Thalassotalea agarivorans]|uniref:Protein SlyX homolog n=1 Tax=Thalassotalea agarivorans TaxID=349064 RepID=A0A1I0CCV1_THASX|nr:SlyX family protein [Thalassotalea agarivorans]SET17101.1 SlyX protein [Thalassotalea agarivorans]
MTESDRTIQARIDELEAKVAFQDDIIEQLNQEITLHQAQLTAVSEQLKLLASRVKQGSTMQMMKPEDEPPPPHY